MTTLHKQCSFFIIVRDDLMTSKYGIITIATLETRTTRDYSGYVAEDGTRLYSDDQIEDWITQAETIPCAYCNTEFDSIAPQSVIFIVKELAKIISDNQLIEDGIIKNRNYIEAWTFFNENYKSMLDTMLAKKKHGIIQELTTIDDYQSGM